MENMTTRICNPKLEKNFYEKKAWSSKTVVCGIDEVGRGCLAGPLITAAVILPANKHHKLLKDSKVLTEKYRDEAYAWIVKHCWYGIGIVCNKTIDRCNIWQSTLIAMKKAALHLLAVCPQRPSAFLIDAMPLQLLDTDYKNIPIFHFPKGESKSTSIAAASIVAKVTRDRLMRVFDPIFPGYNLAQHKGYGTKQHRQTIKKLRHTIIHRQRFLDKINREINGHEAQRSIF